MRCLSSLFTPFIIACAVMGSYWVVAHADEMDDYRDLGYRTTKELMAAPVAQRPYIDQTCPGGYLINLFPASQPIPQGEIWGYADAVNSQQYGMTSMQGHVEIRENGRTACADQADINRTTNFARMQGHLVMSEAGYAATGVYGESLLKQQQSLIKHARYALSSMHAHGKASRITRSSAGVTTIEKGEISTCTPGHRDWWLRSDLIRLDQNTGRGEAIHSVLYTHSIPLVYIPYLNFPIDDRRQSGLLIPVFGSSSTNGVLFSLPIYLNLAPNYDATITPALITKRGLWMQGDFRYLESWGHGEIAGGYLGNDRSGFPLYYNPNDASPNTSLIAGESRKALGWQHSGSFAEGWSAKTDINYVSDNYYYQDLGTTASLSTATYQQRMGEVDYHDKFWSWMSQMQEFQVLDPTVTDANKPYARLPETSLSRLWVSDNHLINAGFNVDMVDFRRSINDGSGMIGGQVVAGDPYIQGNRLRSDPFVGMTMDSPWAFLNPRMTLKHLDYSLNNPLPVGTQSNAQDSIPLTRSVTVPTLSVDSGLYFDRSLAESGTETLEPRLYYLKAPYVNQNNLPIFDTLENPLTYTQLFRDSRFVGGDRLDDANQLALGINNRWLDSDGNENYSFNFGDMRYFQARNVVATLPQQTSMSTGLLSEANARLSSTLSLSGNLSMDPSTRWANRGSINLHWQPPDNKSVFNVGYTYIHAYSSYTSMEGLTTQSQLFTMPTFRMATGSFVTPVGDRWQLIGLWQYDMALYHTQEAIAGLQYENCCWRIRLVDSIYLDDFLAVNNVPGYNRSIVFQFEFKGLGGYSRQMENMLGQAILGYQQISNAERP